MLEYRTTDFWLTTRSRPGDHVVNEGPFLYAYELLSEIVGETTDTLVRVQDIEVNFKKVVMR